MFLILILIKQKKSYIMKKIIENTIRDFVNFSNEKIEYEIYRNQKTGHVIHNGKKWAIVFRVECRVPQVEIFQKNYAGQDIIVIAEKIYGTAKDLMKESGIFFIEHKGAFFWELEDKVYEKDQKNKNYNKIKAASRNEITFSQFVVANFLRERRLYHLN